MVKNYRDLTVWQRAKAFAVEIYRQTEAFPKREQFSLTDQIRRAAVSKKLPASSYRLSATSSQLPAIGYPLTANC